MARNEALLRLHKTLVSRRHELRKRLGIELEDLAHVKHSSASGDVADAAFDASGEEIASTLAELEAKELAQVERAIRALEEWDLRQVRGLRGQDSGGTAQCPTLQHRLHQVPARDRIRGRLAPRRIRGRLGPHRRGRLADGRPGRDNLATGDRHQQVNRFCRIRQDWKARNLHRLRALFVS